MKRLLVYFFWDQDGIVDDYVLESLRALKAHCSTILVVANGPIAEVGQAALRDLSDVLLMRENVGLDAWAYKEAFEYLGYDRLAEYDEVLATNFTLFGPVFPLSDLFGQMEATTCDFWGLVKYRETLPAGDVLHLQSFFVSYRTRLLASPAFREYWNSMPTVRSYEDSVNLHELRQTPFFAARGFTFDSFVPIERYRTTAPYNFIITCAEQVLVDDRCPFIKRRVFFFKDGRFESGITADKIRHITDFIKGYTTYDIGLMHQNLARTQAPVPVAWRRTLKRKLGARLHPRKEVRAAIRQRLVDHDREFRQYLDCFLRVKREPQQLKMWQPPLQHVGRQTYSMPDLFVQCAFTDIGSFCSIGSRVILGHGKHPTDFLSTSPYFYFDELGYKSAEMPAFDKFWFIEPIHVGNDVWIGDGVFVKNGIKIGDGSIVGSRAVVTKDVPPYAIVAGVPARVIGYRFSAGIIAELLRLKWWDLADETIRKIPFYDISAAIEFLSALQSDSPGSLGVP